MSIPTVLFVEDNDDDLELAKLALHSLDAPVNIHFVRNGLEALDFLFAQGDYADRAGEALPKLVMLDLNLPLLDGREVLKMIRENPRTQAVPVVVMTTSAEPPDLNSVVRLHVNSYVQKPMDFERFQARLVQIVRYWLEVNQVAQT
ncbi:response regulator [Lysobacter soyae]|uniref:Response regulator n=1 Tax=Lysobacter soyae TaxID=2764185 RepID=A0ABX8WPT3_9GAMM|nr:response regulator [Lysobacter sp. CJ11]QYR53096.1 response regulator [Lysobacter sp. CJ11]